MSEMLKVSEIFYSIQGESSYAGYPCAFIRLSGCNLRCTYCDTPYVYENGEFLSIEKIVEKIRSFESPLVEVTGGEPLLQEETPELIKALLREHYTVLIETNGTKDISIVPQNAIRIMDIKCPGSGQSQHMDWENISRLREKDEVKFVLMDENDYQWAKEMMQNFQLDKKAHILFSPVYGKLSPSVLAEWILQDRLPVRLQLQLHKILWPNVERGK